jgi:cohesin complex subunit SA-1/2
MQMVEQSQQILTLHILWKGLPYMQQLGQTPDDVFFSQRGALLERLTEYAVGTQSNAVIGVKQVV